MPGLSRRKCPDGILRIPGASRGDWRLFRRSIRSRPVQNNPVRRPEGQGRQADQAGQEKRDAFTGRGVGVHLRDRGRDEHEDADRWRERPRRQVRHHTIPRWMVSTPVGSNSGKHNGIGISIAGMPVTSHAGGSDPVHDTPEVPPVDGVWSLVHPQITCCRWGQASPMHVTSSRRHQRDSGPGSVPRGCAVTQRLRKPRLS